MRKAYEIKWHGTRFAPFARLSSTELADEAFYKSFYEVFFQQHKNWNELDL